MPATISPVRAEPPVVTNESAQPIAPRTVPGFTAEGQPLPDDQVWSAFIGRGKRPLDTAGSHSGGKKIDGHEQRRLLKIAKDDPRSFLTRLLADSMNGTPVEYSMTKTFKGFGVLHATFKAENGQFETKLRVEVFNKAVDQWLKPYLAKDARAKGVRSSADLTVVGKIDMSGGVSDIVLTAAGHDLPKLSADKVSEIEELRKQLTTALKEKSAKRRAEGVKNVFERGVEKMAEFPLHFFLK